MPESHWYQSVIVQLGAGGCFALLLVYLFLKFNHKIRAGGHIIEPVAKDKNGNCMNFQQYNETIILPQLQKLQHGHEKLLVEVAKLPTRLEKNYDNEILHKRINAHEKQCLNYKPHL